MKKLPSLPPVLWAPAVVLLLVLVVPATSSPPAEAFDLAGFSSSLADLAHDVGEATVHLEVALMSKEGDEEEENRWPLRRRRGDGVERKEGSGFVIDATRGLVVTNAHVVESVDARVNAVMHDGRRFTAKVLGVDAQTDVAVVQIREGAARRQLTWGDSDAMRPGEMVIAIGSPLGHTSTTSFGILSGTGRQIGGTIPGQYQDYLQSDTFIDKGSSGGPLVDMHGNVVGINTAILGKDWSGISYSVPSSIARYVASQIIENGEVERGWLGVSMDDVDDQLAMNKGLSRPFGAMITQVTDDSPADDAGLKRGDIIMYVEEVEVASMASLRARIGNLEPGTDVELRVWRNKRPKNIVVTLGTNPDL